MVEGSTILMMRDSKQGAEVGNYRPIPCLNLIWNLLTGIGDKMSLKGKQTITRRTKMEQKKVPRDERSTYNRCILQNCKKRHI